MNFGAVDRLVLNSTLPESMVEQSLDVIKCNQSGRNVYSSRKEHKVRKIHSESTLRRRLKKDMGLFLEKSRARKWSLYNQLGYRIMDYRYNIPLLQSGDYSLTLEEIDAFVYGTDEDKE